jgi:hypothetical protein
MVPRAYRAEFSRDSHSWQGLLFTLCLAIISGTTVWFALHDILVARPMSVLPRCATSCPTGGCASSSPLADNRPITHYGNAESIRQRNDLPIVLVAHRRLRSALIRRLPLRATVGRWSARNHTIG